MAVRKRLLLRIAKGSLLAEEVEHEWDAQIQKIRDAGISPTHLDGHKHVHMLPGLFQIALRLAKKHGIRAIRVSHEDSKLRAVLSEGKDQKNSIIVKQGVQARGLKLLARERAEWPAAQESPPPTIFVASPRPAS